MATAKTTIELNGKLYDARTGSILNSPSSAAVFTPKKPVSTGGAVLDGFTRRSTTTQTPVHSVARPKPAASRTKPMHAKTKLEKSHTLMRPVVKKPSAIVKNDITSPQKSVQVGVNPHRIARAATTQQSGLVRKFGPAQPTVVRRAEPLQVVSQHSAPAHMLSERVAHLATSSQAQVTSSVDLIEQSLQNASAHLEQFEDKILRQSFLKRVGFRNKIANLAAMTSVTVLLFGFFAYQNAASIEMRMASTKAGFSAAMPAYTPSGYTAQKGVQAAPGKVSVNFNSNTNDKKFTVTQQASNWSSDSLLTNHVASTKKPYQTYQDRGKTVFIYDNSNATWVNGGVWYEVSGDAGLSSDQLLRIANSL